MIKKFYERLLISESKRENKPTNMKRKADVGQKLIINIFIPLYDIS
jgi:hypothetical protein